MDQKTQAVTDEAGEKQSLQWVVIDVPSKIVACIRSLLAGALRQDLGSPRVPVSRVLPSDRLGAFKLCALG